MAPRIRIVYAIGLWMLLIAGCSPGKPSVANPNERHFRVTRESVYNQIVVERNGDIVDLHFRVGSSARRQTAVDLTDPTHLVIPYTHTMLAAALVQPHPLRILQIGLGGGGLNRFLVRNYPDAQLLTAELDGDVLALARQYMDFAPGERDEVVIEDGRVFLKRNKGQWDWILVDAFRDGVAPMHLKTVEFYELIKSHLAPDGVVALNLHATNRLFESDKATLLKVFPEVHLFPTPGTGNVVALAFMEPIANFPPTVAMIPGSVPRFRDYLADARSAYSGPAIAGDAPVLTDDFAPVEFLQQQK